MHERELQEWITRCIQEEPPECTAACPLHIDVRAFVDCVAQGRWDEAWKVLLKLMPVPGILASVCDAPCQLRCKRQEAGDAIRIGDLERVCARIASPTSPSRSPLSKGKCVAVVGSGLSSLSCAWDLARKGYLVTILESRDRPGGALLGKFPLHLTAEMIDAEIFKLKQLGVQCILETLLDSPEYLELTLSLFNAVYIGLDTALGERWGLEQDVGGREFVMPKVQTTMVKGLFAGGYSSSPVWQAAEGRWAADSIDRFLQEVSLTAGRGKEGPYATRLFVNIENVSPQPRVPMAAPSEGYTQAEAMREAQRCLQCQCLECVKVCAYLERFGGYPKRYVREIFANEIMVKGIYKANTLVNSCSLCGLCEVVCPHDFAMQEVCLQARQSMVLRGKMPPSPHEFPIRDMLFSNSEKCSFARHQPGAASSSYVFFPGCQLSASAPEHVKKAYALLTTKLTGGVGLMLACCGAPADWSGRSELFQTTLQEFRDQWESLGSPQIILACSTCYEILKTHLTGASVISLWEVLDQLGLPENPPAMNISTVAVQDACTTRHEEHIHKSVRNILQRCGFRVEELALSRERTECCGYGGLMFFANPDLAKEVIRRRIEESPADYVAYCAMCRDYFASRGKRTLHLLDVIFGEAADAAATRRGPGYSQRHENRMHLKNAFLKELWGGSVTEKSEQDLFRLSISPQVWELMENRLILEEDVQAVIRFAETSGTRLLDPQSGHTIAHFRPGSVTYWVEYSPEGEGFVIHNVYSHRMEVAEEAKR